MKILHVCLNGPFTDGWNYQENLITKYHKKLGHEVIVVTSQWIWNPKGELEICLKPDYINGDGVRIIRLQMKGKNDFDKKFRRYKDVYKVISSLKPNLIFIHGCQFLDIKYIAKYAKLHPNVKVYVDNHADFSNSARTFLSKNFLHKVIWRYCAHLIEPYTTKFYGVLPARVDFLKDVYKIPEEKVELLVMGADDEKVSEARNPDVIKEIREKYNIKPEDFLIMTGGKIDNAKKQTLLLMEAVKRIQNENVRLIVFGSVINELKEKVNKLLDGDRIQYIGWINSEDCYKYFAAADLVVFPGRHSVFWEQVVGLGIPIIVKYWEGTTHIDLGGNCKFLYNDSVDEIYKLLINIINDKDEFSKMKGIAESKGMKYFSYKNISSRAIEV